MITKKFKIAFFLALDAGGDTFRSFVKMHPMRCMHFARSIEDKSEEEIKLIREGLAV